MGKQLLRVVLHTLIKIYTFAPNFKFGLNDKYYLCAIFPTIRICVEVMTNFVEWYALWVKPQRIMHSNNLLEVGKYSNMEDELCGYQERMIGQESKTPPKIW